MSRCKTKNKRKKVRPAAFRSGKRCLRKRPLISAVSADDFILQNLQIPILSSVSVQESDIPDGKLKRSCFFRGHSQSKRGDFMRILIENDDVLFPSVLFRRIHRIFHNPPRTPRRVHRRDEKTHPDICIGFQFK